MNEQVQYKQYADFRKKQLELADILKESSEVIADLNMNKMCENLKKLSDKVQNDTFKVQIVGTFKNGKSTFINSILGAEILPAYALPCTAIVNEVKWGEEKRAVVHFRNPLPEKLPSGIPDSAMQHMKKHNMKNIPPIEIPYDEIEKYAVISIGYGKDEIDYESPHEKIEVYWPLPILRNGVEIIDSPGYAPEHNDPELRHVAEEAAALAVGQYEFKSRTYNSTGSTDMGDLSRIMPTVQPFCPGARGTGHGKDYYIVDPVAACVDNAKFQLAMLSLLLSDGAKRARGIIDAYEPEYPSKESYLEFLDSLRDSGDRIEYRDDGSANVRL